MKTAHDLVVQAKSIVKEIDVHGAQALMKEVDYLIDVREPEEFSAGHIQGAILIPRGLLEFKVSSTEELNARDKKILIYCKTGGRSLLAAKSLVEMGYANIVSLDGGYDAWLLAGYPVIKAEMPKFD